MNIDMARLRGWHAEHPWQEIQLASLLWESGPDSAETGPQAKRIRTGSTYWGKPDRPVHVITSEHERPGGKAPTLCGRSTDAGVSYRADSEVTCRLCAKRLAALRDQMDSQQRAAKRTTIRRMETSILTTECSCGQRFRDQDDFDEHSISLARIDDGTHHQVR